MLVVDDHRLVADAMRGVLDSHPEIVVIGTAAGLDELAAFDASPDVVLMDYLLLDGTGADGTRIAKARWPRVRVVMVTSIRDDETILETVRAGADGYLTKDRALHEVIAAVRSANAGRVLLPPEILGDIAQRLNSDGGARQRARLTARELQVLRHLAGGRSNLWMADHLHLSPATIRTHVQAIRKKLEAHSKLEAVAIAVSQGLIAGPSQRSVAI